ncbi:uncharacterized protein I303_104620 [Kwoniella dejecticola CBS 10117]|uniref:Wbp11/ELF5/Saf1 N-terminal domain-containing protein n=1 Tax=Kwoniella dejecticola CBS 10117 TaxID=1296121 RepID=A0A1A6A4T7_9TREE|nr:uncharacterized protein I303_04402 [Kwoniella dejecticola CBS 10117]OBR85071.1 hypothetical protein I303_04402 [Kwoniella dejecticola CBS 10117]
MAKKSSNPADAFRKAQRAKELKKNKEERKKVREVQTVKKDTREIEADIRYLKSQTDAASKTRLTELESELSYINKTKEAYVEQHPEARDRVFNIRKPKENAGTTREEAQRHLYDENGRLRDPKKSIYYDAVYNPFGVPPPGMPYRERTPEAQSEHEDDVDEDEEDSDDEIIMPEGPPPTGQAEAIPIGVDSDDEDGDNDSDDSDDIPLPEGPPPPKPPSAMPPPMRLGFDAPPGIVAGFRPPLPRPMAVPLHAHTHVHSRPPPPFAPPFAQASYGPGPSTFRPPRQLHNRPPPMVQDPLSDAPTQTYQGHRIAQHALPSRPGGPSNPGSGPDPSTATSSDAPTPTPATGTGEISAAPVLRDLRKEATVFVPRGVKKRKTGASGFINAAPGAGEIDEEGDERKRVSTANEGLMGKLQGVLGDKPMTRPSSEVRGSKGDDDYQKFLEGLGDLA